MFSVLCFSLRQKDTEGSKASQEENGSRTAPCKTLLPRIERAHPTPSPPQTSLQQRLSCFRCQTTDQFCGGFSQWFLFQLLGTRWERVWLVFISWIWIHNLYYHVKYSNMYFFQCSSRWNVRGREKGERNLWRENTEVPLPSPLPQKHRGGQDTRWDDVNVQTWIVMFIIKIICIIFEMVICASIWRAK